MWIRVAWCSLQRSHILGVHCDSLTLVQCKRWIILNCITVCFIHIEDECIPPIIFDQRESEISVPRSTWKDCLNVGIFVEQTLFFIFLAEFMRILAFIYFMSSLIILIYQCLLLEPLFAVLWKALWETLVLYTLCFLWVTCQMSTVWHQIKIIPEFHWCLIT